MADLHCSHLHVSCTLSASFVSTLSASIFVSTLSACLSAHWVHPVCAHGVRSTSIEKKSERDAECAELEGMLVNVTQCNVM